MRIAVSLLVLLFSIDQARAESPPTGAQAPEADLTTLATVLVTGEQPGPGLWRVSRDGHQMWVLGTVSPLPRRMRWNSDEITARIAESGALLAPPSLHLESGVGRFRGLLLVPALLKARRNPDGAGLRDVLTETTYQRWSVLKARYLPGDRAVERWRPLFAAQKLHEGAVRSMGMRLSGVVQPVVERAARRHQVPIVRPKVTIEIEEPRQTLRDFSASPLDDLECFRLNLEHLEADMHSLVLRANAWAEGDIDELRRIPLVDQVPACIEAVLNASVITERGLEGLPQRMREQWLVDAERLLGEHETSFAVLPMRLILDDDGLLPALRARGYRVEAPDEIELEPYGQPAPDSVDAPEETFDAEGQG